MKLNKAIFFILAVCAIAACEPANLTDPEDGLRTVTIGATY